MINSNEWWEGYPPEEKENECEYCGEPCDVRFCCKECEMAYISDNTDRSDD